MSICIIHHKGKLIQKVQHFLPILAILLLVCLNTPTQLSAQSTIRGFDILKNTKSFGLYFSLGDKSSENEDQFVQYVHTLKKNSWSVSADGGYTFTNYQNAGIRLSIAQTLEKSQITPLGGEIGDINSFSRAFTVAPYLKTYIPIDKNRILYICNRTELFYTYESKIKETNSQEILNRQLFTLHTFGLGLRPGLLVFILDGFGFEMSLNVLGLTHTSEINTNTNKPDTKISTTDIDLKIDILKLNLGFNYYF